MCQPILQKIAREIQRPMLLPNPEERRPYEDERFERPDERIGRTLDTRPERSNSVCMDENILSPISKRCLHYYNKKVRSMSGLFLIDSLQFLLQI